MKIVLLEDIKGLGVRGEVCTVGDGYALNFLIPQKKALETKDDRGVQVVQQKATKDQQRQKRVLVSFHDCWREGIHII